MLSVLALGMLIAVGAAIDGAGFDGGRDGGHSSHGDNNHDFGDHNNHDFGGFNKYYDWLSPGGFYYTYSYPVYSYSYSYPAYYYPAYTYTYPTYTYTTPVVYTYDPVIYDPWYAVNVYGLGGATYYYSSSWSWSSYHGGYWFH
jgi:hypothetical protein